MVKTKKRSIELVRTLPRVSEARCLSLVAEEQ